MTATARHLRPVPDPPGDLERLFMDHNEMIFRAAYRVTGNPVDAEDVLQTVFLRMVKREGEIDLSPSPAAYFHRAAVNASLDMIRSRNRSKSIGIDDAEPMALESFSAGPAEEHETLELRKLIKQAVAKLDPRAAEMFALRYFEGFGNNEIADMMGTSQMVVGVTLHRARARMRKEIGKYLEVQQ